MIDDGGVVNGEKNTRLLLHPVPATACTAFFLHFGESLRTLLCWLLKPLSQTYADIGTSFCNGSERGIGRHPGAY